MPDGRAFSVFPIYHHPICLEEYILHGTSNRGGIEYSDPVITLLQTIFSYTSPRQSDTSR